MLAESLRQVFFYSFAWTSAGNPAGRDLPTQLFQNPSVDSVRADFGMLTTLRRSDIAPEVLEARPDNVNIDTWKQLH